MEQYAILLMITVVFQILVSIAAFSVIGSSSVRPRALTLVKQNMMNYEQNQTFVQEMDWIQSSVN